MKEKEISKERQQQARIAWKELYYMYKDDIHKVNLHCGRNNFFDILCLTDMPEKRNRSYAVSDIIYLRTGSKSLILDKYMRKISGCYLSENLRSPIPNS
jgi:hypothetical protein